MSKTQEYTAEEVASARELGLRLYELRAAQRMSQQSVASAAGMSLYSYQRLEKGVSASGTPYNPQIFTLARACKALGASVADVLSGLV